jgi:hypothetical protein
LVLAVDVGVAIGDGRFVSWTAGFVMFSVRFAVFVDVFVQGWGMVQGVLGV